MSYKKCPIQILTNQQSILKATGMLSDVGKKELENKAKEICNKEFKENLKKELSNYKNLEI